MSTSLGSSWAEELPSLAQPLGEASQSKYSLGINLYFCLLVRAEGPFFFFQQS